MLFYLVIRNNKKAPINLGALITTNLFLYIKLSAKKFSNLNTG